MLPTNPKKKMPMTKNCSCTIQMGTTTTIRHTPTSNNDPIGVYSPKHLESRRTGDAES